jgi:hypothetical protein
MVSLEQKKRVEEMRKRLLILKKEGWDNKRLENLLVNLDLPLGAHLHLLRSIR